MAKMVKKITKFVEYDDAVSAAKDLVAAVTSYAASRGLTVTYEKIGKVDLDGCDVHLKVVVISEAAAQATQEAAEREDYIQRAALLGLKPEWLDKMFWAKGGNNVYTIVGLSSDAKFPVMVEKGRNGRRYSYKLDAVKEQMDAMDKTEAKIAAEKADKAA